MLISITKVNNESPITTSNETHRLIATPAGNYPAGNYMFKVNDRNTRSW